MKRGSEEWGTEGEGQTHAALEFQEQAVEEQST